MTNRGTEDAPAPVYRVADDRPTVGHTIGDDDPFDDDDVLPAANRLGRYTVLDKLGAGGMGIVCTAYDPKLDRKVAIKVLRVPTDQGFPTRAQARLVREAQALARLSHANIVSVHDVGTHDGQLYMAMEYIDGLSLDRWLESSRSWREVVDVLIHAGRGLAAAHEADIVHRDFKPANVLIGHDGRVCVVDFGLAKSPEPPSSVSPDGGPQSVEAGSQSAEHSSQSMEQGSQSAEHTSQSKPPYSFDELEDGASDTSFDARITESGRLLGTPAYMAPEQFLGLGADTRTDQFSFGVTLYEALYGTLPFPSKSLHGLIQRATEGELTEPRDTAVPSWVFRVIARILKPRPDERYPSMLDVLTALQADPARRRRRVAAAGMGLLLVGLAANGIVRQLDREPAVCSGAQARIDEVWSSERKQQMEAAFTATQKSFADDEWRGTENLLDRYSERWVALHTEVCEATNVRREQSESLMDIRMACLERGHRELRALVGQLVQADEAVVQRATRAAQELGDVEVCTRVQQDRAAPSDPQLASGVREVEALLAEVQALHHTGKPAEALDVGLRALEQAESLGHPPTLAHARFEVAWLRQMLSHDPQSIREDMVKAIELATQTQQPALEARAWTKLMMLEGGALNRPESALTLQLPARIAAARSDDPALVAAVAKALGVVHSLAGDYDAALREYRSALDQLQRHYGPQHYSVANLWANLGGIYGNVRRYDEALAALDQAIELFEELSGPNHPLLGSALVNRGSVLTVMDQHERARNSYSRALAIFEQVLPPAHQNVLRTRIGLANAEQKLGGLDRARTELEAILPLLQESETPDLTLMWVAHRDLGEVFESMAQQPEPSEKPEALWQRAREHHEHALRTLDGRSDRGSVERRARTHRSLCDLALTQDRPDAALTHCQAAWASYRGQETSKRAREVLELLARVHHRRGETGEAIALLRDGIAAHEGSDTPDAGDLHLQLAGYLWEQAEGSEAHEQAQLARQRWLQANQDERVAEVDRWIDGHPLTPGKAQRPGVPH